MTIDRFYKLTGRDTLHPLICTVDLPHACPEAAVGMKCDFYGLLYCDSPQCGSECLRLIRPGEAVGPLVSPDGLHGVLFHPDLLCDTPLERRIDDYPIRCSCHGVLTERERRTISDCLGKIDKELHHAIDRHSAPIIVSHIELLLNYCVRFCNQ